MDQKDKITISVQVTINTPIDLVWKSWTNPEDIVKWNNASDDWHTSKAENDLRKGGKFLSRMEAKDGSAGFDFSGVYTDVKHNKLIEYFIDDGRKVTVNFEDNGNETKITETFEAEETHSIELQKNGWQSILNNFKSYTERKKY